MSNTFEFETSDLRNKWKTYPIDYFDDERLISNAEMKYVHEGLTRAAIDQLCIPEGENSRLKCLIFKLRPSASKPTPEVTGASTTNRELEEEIITSSYQLDHSLEQINVSELQQTIVYYFDSRNSWSRLQLTEEMLRKILAAFVVQPKLIPILLTFGEKINATEESYISYFDKIPELSPFRTRTSTAFTELNGYEIGYNIKYVARHTRDRPRDPFVVRQTGVYQKFIPHDKKFIWIFTQAASSLKDRLKSLLEKYNREPEDAALQVEIHLAILTHYGENWRPYITYLENSAEESIDRGFYSQPIAQPNADSLQAEISDVRELHFLGDKLRRLLQLIDLDISIAQKLSKLVQRLVGTWSEATLDFEISPRLRELISGIEEHIFSLEVSKSRIVTLLDRIRDISTLVRQVLDFRNESSNRIISLNLQELAAAGVEENRNIAYLAEKGEKDTRMMKLITVITAIFLPATLVASVFGTNFFDFDEQSQKVIVANNIWIYFVIAIGVTGILLVSWVLWKIRIKVRLFRGVRKMLLYLPRRKASEKSTLPYYTPDSA